MNIFDQNALWRARTLCGEQEVFRHPLTHPSTFQALTPSQANLSTVSLTYMAPASGCCGGIPQEFQAPRSERKDRRRKGVKLVPGKGGARASEGERTRVNGRARNPRKGPSRHEETSS